MCDESFVDFGSYILSHVKDKTDSKIVWTALDDSFFWQTTCQGVSFGLPSSDNAFSFPDSTGNSSIIAIFDTGTSFTMIPEYYWQPYVE